MKTCGFGLGNLPTGATYSYIRKRNRFSSFGGLNVSCLCYQGRVVELAKADER